MTPNIFHKCKFVYSWRISGDGGTVLFDFLSYMLRPEAFEPSKHADEMEYVYSEFIPNEKIWIRYGSRNEQAVQRAALSMQVLYHLIMHICEKMVSL